MSWQHLVDLLRNDLPRRTLCRLGLHTKPTGHGLDACTRGCGYCRHPEALRPYVVTLKDGTALRVRAVNPYHAESLVVFAGAPLRWGPGGTVRGEVQVHRGNIQSVELASHSLPTLMPPDASGT